jgi:kynurenine formamidase
MCTVPTKLYATKPPRFEFIGVVDEKQKHVLSKLGLELATDICVGYLANVSRFELLAHGGTHIDAPRHFFASREGITDIDIHAFVKTGVRIDLSHKRSGESISSSDLKKAAPKVSSDEIPVIYTGWTERAWGSNRFYEDSPWFKSDVAEWVMSLGVQAFGCDCFNDTRNFDLQAEGDSAERFPVHSRLLRERVLLIELLTNLSQLSNERFLLVALPLKIRGAEAAPARVVAIEEK